MSIRELASRDYNEYIKLMKQLTNYEYNTSIEDFSRKLELNANYMKIFVLVNDNDSVIGTGTVVKLEKLHNNCAAQIEDVVIDEQYRGKGYGKLIVEYLVNYAYKNYKCYKVILNCLDHNIQFYEKIGFIKSSNQMKYNNT